MVKSWRQNKTRQDRGYLVISKGLSDTFKPRWKRKKGPSCPHYLGKSLPNKEKWKGPKIKTDTVCLNNIKEAVWLVMFFKL